MSNQGCPEAHVEKDVVKDRFSPPRVVAFSVLLLTLIILSAWLGTLVHEALGHCLMYVVFGGTAYRFTLDLFGGGMAFGVMYTDHWFPTLVTDFGGILVNIVTATLLFAWVRKRQRWSVWTLFLVLFVLICVLGQIGYACVGFYYDIGDPIGWGGHVPVLGRHVWLLFLVATPFVAYALMPPYVRLQQQLFPIASPYRRVAFACLTLGSAICVFIPLCLASSTLHRNMFPAQAARQAEKRVREQKMQALTEQLREESPELSEEDIEQRVKETPIEVKPDEVRVGPWVVIAFFVLMVAGGLIALWCGEPGPVDLAPSLTARSLVIPLAAVAVGLSVLWWNQNTFPWPRFGQGLPLYEGTISDELVAGDWGRFPFDTDDEGTLYYTDRYTDPENGTLVRFEPATSVRTTLLSGLNDPYLCRVIGRRVYFEETDAAVTGTSRLMCYDLQSGECTPIVEGRQPRRWVLVMRDGRLITSHGRDLLLIQKSGDDRLFARLPSEIPGWIRCLAEGTDGTVWVAAGEWSGERDALLRFAADGKTYEVMAEGLSSVSHIDTDSAGNVYVAGDGYSSLMFVELEEGTQAWELRAGRQPRRIAFHVAATAEGTIYYSQWRNGFTLRRLGFSR